MQKVPLGVVIVAVLPTFLTVCALSYLSLVEPITTSTDLQCVLPKETIRIVPINGEMDCTNYEVIASDYDSPFCKLLKFRFSDIHKNGFMMITKTSWISEAASHSFSFCNEDQKLENWEEAASRCIHRKRRIMNIQLIIRINWTCDTNIFRRIPAVDITESLLALFHTG